MIDRILVKYGDLTLKGRNRKTFIKTAINRIKERIDNDNITYEASHNRLYIHLNGEAHAPIIKTLDTVSGLSSYAKVMVCDKTIDDIVLKALSILKGIEKPTTIKVETKRNDKKFPIESLEVSKKVAAKVLPNNEWIKADVKNPEVTLNVEIRQDNALVYLDDHKGLGGFPVGTMGKSIALLSGGIDSPVAAYLSMIKGIEVELIHFESTPLTSIESAQKAIDLSKELSTYGIDQKVKLHMVPFLDIHQKILEMVPAPYQITIMRRMMMRIAEGLANQDFTPALINGESIGQVASQSLDSMKVTEMVTSIPVLRPLAVMEKNEIIKIAKAINTYDISIRPFEDCCSVYVPKKPAIHPRDFYALRYETLFDYKALIEAAIHTIHTLTISKASSFELSATGLSVKEALGED